MTTRLQAHQQQFDSCKATLASIPDQPIPPSSSSGEAAPHPSLFSYAVKTFCTALDYRGHHDEVNRLRSENTKLNACLTEIKEELAKQSRYWFRYPLKPPAFYYDEIARAKEGRQRAEVDRHVLEAEIQRLSAELLELQDVPDILQQEVDFLKLRLEKVTAVYEEEARKALKAKAGREKAEADRQMFEADVQRLSAELSDLHSVPRVLQQEVDSLKMQLEKAAAVYEEESKRALAAEEACAKLGGQLNIVHDIVLSKDFSLIECQTCLDKLTVENSQCRQVNEGLVSQLNDTQVQMADVESRLKKAHEDIEGHKSILSDIIMSTAELPGTIKQLEQKLKATNSEFEKSLKAKNDEIHQTRVTANQWEARAERFCLELDLNQTSSILAGHAHEFESNLAALRYDSLNVQRREENEELLYQLDLARSRTATLEDQLKTAREEIKRHQATPRYVYGGEARWGSTDDNVRFNFFNPSPEIEEGGQWWGQIIS